MRVKSVLAPVGVAVLVAIAVPGVSNASRGGAPSANVESETPQPSVDEATPAPSVVDEPPAEPTLEAPAEPVAEEPSAEPVVRSPRIQPVADPTPIGEEAPAAPVIEEPRAVEPPVVEEPPAEPIEAMETPTLDGGEDGKGRVRNIESKAEQSDGCHMDSFESSEINSLDNDAEIARAEKVDRNGNGTVCRKEIPGRGRGNTGQGTNIKDDKVR